jgi:hypothetical protein
LCTDKDAIKLFAQPAAAPDAHLWRVPLTLLPEPDWYATIDSVLAGWRCTPQRL